ncbi:MAG: sigma-70 family RNA polymerase sigma factor [Desulfobacterales bacterium]
MSSNRIKHITPREESLRQEIVSFLPRLRRFARSLARDPDTSDDLVQAACQRALERLDQVRDGTRLDSWLYRIIYTRWIDKVRRGKTRTATLVLLTNEDAAVAADGSGGKDLAVALDIKKALGTLPAEHHAAIMLVSVEGYSYEEAASVLDVPVGTVASRVARGRTMLGRFLTHGRPEDRQPSKRLTGERAK